MPVQKKWYEEFKKNVIANKQLREADGAFYLRTPDDKFLFEPSEMINGIDLLKLNDKQIETLHAAVENGGVVIAEPNGGKNFKMLYNSKSGECKSTVPFGTIQDQEYPEVIKGSLEKYNAIPDSMIVKEQKIKGLNETIKTVTDMYGGTSIEELSGAQWIFDSKGNPIQSKNPWQVYEKIYNASNLEEGVILQSVPNKESAEEKTYKLARESGILTRREHKEPFVSPKVKGKVTLELWKVNDELKKMKTKNPDLLKLQGECEKTIEELSKTSDLKQFKKILNEYANSADSYFEKMAPAKLGAGKVSKLGSVGKIRRIRDAVEKGADIPDKEDKIKDMQERIAAKMVKASSLAIVGSNTASPEEKTRAQGILNDPKLFGAEVNKTITQDADFKYLYGSRMPGDGADLLTRLQAGVEAKATDIVKAVQKEHKDPTPEKLRFQKYMAKERTPRRESMLLSTMPLDKQKEVLSTIKQLETELHATGGSTSSPEYEQLQHAIDVTKIRLDRGNKWMDVNKQLADICDSAEAFQAKLSKSGSLRSKTINQLTAVKKLSGTLDAIIQGKKPPEAPTPDGVCQDLLAEKIVNQTIAAGIASNDKRKQMAAKEVYLNRNLFDAEKKKLLDSQEFKKLYGGPGKAASALGSRVTSVEKSLASQKVAIEKSAQKAAEKTQKEQEVKVLGDKKNKNGPMVGGR